MKRSPNQIRAMRRNTIRGRIILGKNACIEVMNSSNIFSSAEIELADEAYEMLINLLTNEPRNYIKTRYPTGK